jgi:two-component system, OmpR family, phosphate regulon sensor histidine kinase PhoR
MKPVPVAEVLGEVTRQLQPAAQARGLGLEAEIRTRPTMLAQRAHLRSLWCNLVDNALQYTPRGRVRVTLSEQNGLITSQVVDTGIGISTEEVARIFQEFYRSESARTLVPFGTGLGLAIVDQIVKIYRGSIQVDSTLGQGSTFTVCLPVGGSMAA